MLLRAKTNSGVDQKCTQLEIENSYKVEKAGEVFLRLRTINLRSIITADVDKITQEVAKYCFIIY